MNKFPQIHQLAELKQEIGNIYSIFFDKEIKSIIFKLSEKEAPSRMASGVSSINHKGLKKKKKPNTTHTLSENRKRKHFPIYFEANSTIKSKLDNDITWKGHDGITSFININVKHKIIANQSNIILKG